MSDRYPPDVAGALYRDGAAAIDWLVRRSGSSSARVEDAAGEILPRRAALGARRRDAHLVAADQDGSLAAMLGTAWVWVVVDDADEHHRRAAAAGARVLSPPRSVVPGSRSYRALDLEGNRWTFSTHGPGG